MSKKAFLSLFVLSFKNLLIGHLSASSYTMLLSRKNYENNMMFKPEQ